MPVRRCSPRPTDTRHVEHRERLQPCAPPASPESWARRLSALGIRSRAMRGGGPTLATMPLSERPFAGLERSCRFERVLFATVGAHTIKCLKPLDLFYLPPIDVRGCDTAPAVEERIRAAWRTRVEQLASPWAALRRGGTAARARSPDSAIRIPVEGVADRVHAVLVRPGEIVLPSRGPLRGLGLQRRSERVLRVGSAFGGDAELQLRVGQALDETARRANEASRKARSGSASRSQPELATVGVRHHRLLLVGPSLARDPSIHGALVLRGYTVETARDTGDALRLFRRCTPELVITEADLGRGDGLELVPMLRATAGIEHLPVIVVDPRPQPARREAARRIGARGYIGGTLDVGRIARRLAELLDAPDRRRFTRYAEPLTVRWAGRAAPATAVALSRAGLLVAAGEDLPTNSLQRCELLLSGRSRTIEVEAEVLYRIAPGRGRPGGVGLRFDRFGADAESSYLEFLRSLEAA